MKKLHAHELKLKDKVIHPTFGKGEVIEIENGSGATGHIRIKFDNLEHALMFVKSNPWWIINQ